MKYFFVSPLYIWIECTLVFHSTFEVHFVQEHVKTSWANHRHLVHLYKAFWQSSKKYFDNKIIFALCNIFALCVYIFILWECWGLDRTGLFCTSLFDMPWSFNISCLRKFTSRNPSPKEWEPSHHALDPTFGIHSHNTLDTAQPSRHLLKPNWKPSSSHSISAPTNINTQFLLHCVRFHIIPYVNCFGRTVLYVCIDYCI